MMRTQYRNSFGHTNHDWHRPAPDPLYLDLYINKNYLFILIYKTLLLKSIINLISNIIIILNHSSYCLKQKIYSKLSTPKCKLTNDLGDILRFESKD